jgi:hypothetical protein
MRTEGQSVRSGKLLLVLASTTILGSESRGTYYIVLLLHIKNAQRNPSRCAPSYHFTSLICVLL